MRILAQVAFSLLLGAVFLASALPKLRQPKGFVLSVLEYRVLPRWLAHLYAWLVPPAELLVALLLLSGVALRLAALLVALLLISFMIAIGINMRRGRPLDCHCFGPRARRRIGWGTLLQDGVLLGVSCALALLAPRGIEIAAWSFVRGPQSLGMLAWALLALALALALILALILPRASLVWQPRVMALSRWVVSGTAWLVWSLPPRESHPIPTRPATPLAEGDGPPLGSALPAMRLDPLNGTAALDLAARRASGGCLVVFLSPLCATCQRIVEPLNALARAGGFAGQAMVILHGDETTCRTFLTVFSLRLPTICDADGEITRRFDIHHTPYELLYDAEGRLARKERLSEQVFT